MIEREKIKREKKEGEIRSKGDNNDSVRDFVSFTPAILAKNDKSEVRTGFLCVDVCTCVYTLLHFIIYSIILKIQSRKLAFLE